MKFLAILCRIILTPIATEITAVTVYTDRALVIRHGTLSLTGTETGLTFSNLPVTLNPGH